ncbi:MAG: type IV secretory system conjugative DNA transfer family protein [Lachnospiraceae bacterium]|nr:type IV secretory system conjugative DNA transfer family protein [Lachnospiraceae bacterium]
MKRQNNFKFFILHYGIIQLFIALMLSVIITFILGDEWIEMVHSVFPNLDASDDTYMLILEAFLFGTILMLYRSFLHSVIYHDSTGRNLSKDTGEFHMSYEYLCRYFRNADDKRIKESELPTENWRNSEGIILGKVKNRLVKRASAGVGNCALFGRPGDGKTTSQIIPSALKFEGSVLCIDIKGDVKQWTESTRRIKIFNPDNAKESCCFNPFGDIDKMTLTKVKSFIENMGLALIPDEAGDNSKFFVDGARDFWNGISLYMIHEDKNTGFMDIVDAILTSNPFEWVERVVNSTVKESKAFLAAYLGGNEKNIAGQYKKCCDSLRPFTNGDLPELLSSNKFAITPEMLDEGYDIYIEIPQDKIDLYAPITTIIINNFMMYFMNRKDSSTGEKLRPILFLLDEFPQLHFNFNTLTSALATLRSKKVSLFMAQQSIAQLERRYGDSACREIIDNCAYISVMSAQDPKSREFFQKLVGSRKTLKVNKSDSTQGNHKTNSRNVQPVIEPVYQPEDFGNLNDKIVIIANGKYIEADKCKCYET